MVEDNDHDIISGDDDSDKAINNNNNAMNCDDDERENTDIKEKLLKMNLALPAQKRIPTQRANFGQ